MKTELTAAYQSAGQRLFLLDYDGTLADLKPTPPEAKPTAELIDMLQQLTSDPRNTVVIISGRDRETLDAWLGDLPLNFAAEHGYWRKIAGEGWHATSTDSGEWRQTVNRLMKNADAQCHGASTEEKTSALAWHYRNAADPAAAQAAAQQLLAHLEPLREQLGIRIMNGNKVIEVQAQGTDKGAAAQFWLNSQRWDFMLAAGDDVTDEDLFKVMPAGAFVLKVGDTPSMAPVRVASPSALLALMRTFFV